MTYLEDPRTWADRLCDAAPRAPRSSVRATRRTKQPDPTRGLTAHLLSLPQFTAEEVAEKKDCWPSSVRSAIGRNRDLFECISERRGNRPAVWRAKL